MQDKEAISRTARELVLLLASQGLVYAEIRFAPQLHTRKELTQSDAVDAVLEGVNEGMAEAEKQGRPLTSVSSVAPCPSARPT